LLAIAVGGGCEIHYLWQPLLRQKGVPVGTFGFVAVGICVVSASASHAVGLVPRHRHRTSIAAIYVLMLVCLGAVVVVGNAAVGIAAVLLIVMLPLMANPMLMAMINERLPDGTRATALSAVSCMTSVVYMTIRPLVGFLADRNILYPFGFGFVFVALGLALVPLTWHCMDGKRLGRSG
jgi:hypothetical protein